MADRARAELDDRDLTSRSDKRNVRMTEAEALLSLAGALSELSLKQLESLGVTDDLLRLLIESRRIEAPGPKARHLKLVRRALQAADVERLQTQVDAIRNPSRWNPAPPSNATLRKRKALELAEALVAGGDPALFEFCSQHPRVDRAELRKLMRNVTGATGEARVPHVRRLGQILLTTQEANPAAIPLVTIEEESPEVQSPEDENPAQE
jgi:ribosomal 50S subunit-associated protein YjgA (DUF615 family)